ncbi:concanavalin A-like lectin/glucanase [Hymenopellis radicata]|nr:concanavalin A-like lectin/glucanase [Hymenopellis radicata]
MSSSSTAPIATSEDLSPPQPKFYNDYDAESDVSHTPGHRAGMSRTSVDFPPPTPRSLSFTPTMNPFSPPASVRSFSTPTDSPLVTPAFLPATSHYPFPDPNTPRSGITSVASFCDLSGRASHGPWVVRSGARAVHVAAAPPNDHIQCAPDTKVTRERPKSTMLVDGETLHKPWLEKKDKHSRLAYLLTYSFAFLGIAAAAVKCYFDWKSGVFGDDGIFFREVDMSGFGNGEFEMTTNSPNNSFVHDGALYILPTLTEDSIGSDAILDGHVFNITDCTFNITRGISYTQSSTHDPFTLNHRHRQLVVNSIINPVQSARLSTRKTASIRYGKVEVRAKLPTGDWMWPAIWMLPVDNTYGSWPMSGEIDIMEARGNGPSYPKQGSNYVRGSLNWGPMIWLNAVAKTYGWWKLRRGGYNDEFHTYSIEWTEDFVRIYVDTRLHHMFETKIKQSFWDRGEFPPVILNGSESIVLEDPWVNGTKAAPFDQRESSLPLHLLRLPAPLHTLHAPLPQTSKFKLRNHITLLTSFLLVRILPDS